MREVRRRSRRRAQPSRCAVRSRPRRPPGDFVHEDAEQDVAPRRGIACRESARHQFLQQSLCPSIRVGRTDLGVQQVEGALHDDAVPVEQSSYVIRLERAPRVMEQGRQLRAGAGAPEYPLTIGHVIDRLDVDAFVTCEGETPDIASCEQFMTLRGCELSELWRRRWHVMVLGHKGHVAVSHDGTPANMAWRSRSRDGPVRRGGQS